MLVSAAWIVPAIFAVVDYVAQIRLNDWGPVNPGDLLFQAGDWFLYAVLTPGVFALSRRWPITRPHLLQRLFLHVLFSLGFCIAWATLGKIFGFYIQLFLNQEQLQQIIAKSGDHLAQRLLRDWVSWIFTTLPFGVAVYLCMAGMEHATRYFTEMRDREVQVARLSEQLTGARLAALQAQLNPHFLFNSLNTINVLVRDGDASGATRVIEQLSDVLRTTLSRSRDSEVSLDDELHLVREYLNVEQARFSDRLVADIDVDPSLLSAAVPSFALQHLVENAIRHGIARRTDSGRVAVGAARDGDVLMIDVRDDGPGLVNGATEVAGHGLENTRERLRTLYGDRASLTLRERESGGVIASLRVPYREIVLEARG